jgi:Skp family chaperone for outer membrane proteins
MTKSTFKIWAGICLVISLSALAFSLANYVDTKAGKRQVYMDLGRAFNEFGYKKELEQQLLGIQENKKRALDSLSVLIRNKEAAGTPTAELKQEYTEKRRHFDEENRDYAAHFDQRIWTKLNELVELFGKERPYAIIFGSQGEGNIMYGKEDLDITDEVITYINQHYRDEKK